MGKLKLEARHRVEQKKDFRLEENGVCGKGISKSSLILAAIEVIDLDDADLCDSAEPFNGNLSLNETTEFSNEELEQIVYELKHAFG